VLQSSLFVEIIAQNRIETPHHTMRSHFSDEKKLAKRHFGVDPVP
jgi:hypothetical protein